MVYFLSDEAYLAFYAPWLSTVSRKYQISKLDEIVMWLNGFSA